MHRNAYDSLAGGSRVRLRAKREYATRYPGQYKSWRDVGHVGKLGPYGYGLPAEGRLTAFTVPPDGAECHGNAPFKVGSDLCRWVENATAYFPEVRWCDKIVPIRHTGWYTDVHSSSDQVARGVVLTLPGRRGYVAAIADPHNFNRDAMASPCIVELNYVYDDEDKCARGADDLARIYAETCREDDVKFHAEQDIEQAEERIASIRSQVRELVTGIRESKLAPVVCGTLRRTLRGLLQEKTEAYALIEKRKDDPWSAAPGY